MTIYMEARGEGPAGMLGVAEVIRNRTAKKFQSDGTVAGTCLRPFQFSCWNTTDPNRRLAASIDDADPIVLACREAWRMALADSDTVHDAVSYLNRGIIQRLPDWVSAATFVTTIGHHDFYRT